MRNLTLTSKMTIAVSSLVVCIILFLGLAGLAFFRDRLRETIRGQQSAMVAALAERIDQELITSRTEITELAEGITPAILEDPVKAQHLLDLRGKAELFYDDGLVLLSGEGRLIAETPVVPSRRGKDFSFREYFRKVVTTGRPYISGPYTSDNGSRHPVIMFAAPVVDANGGVAGVLGGSIDLTGDNAIARLPGITIGRSGYLGLRTADGITVMHPDRTRIMTKEASLLPRPGESQERVNSRGVVVLSSSRELRSTGWVLATSYPVSEAFAPVRTATKYLTVSLVLMGALSVLIVRSLMRKLTAPLRQLTSHIREMPAKEGEERFVTIEANDETATMAEAFNAMVRDLDARQEALGKSRAELQVKHEELNLLFRQVEVAKQEWESTMDCIGDLVMLVDGAGAILRCNRAVAELTGTGFNRLRGTALEELFPGLKPRQGNSGELFHAPSGRWFDVSSYPFRATGEGNGSTVVLSLHDTTVMKQVGTELEQAYAELKATHSQMLQQEKMASIGQLAAGVAHEINNPIGFVSSNLSTLDKYLTRLTEFIALQGERLADSPDELREQRKRLKVDYIVEDAKELIRESLEGTERVRKIVQNLKSFSRVDEAELKPVDINDCLESTINIAWNEIKYKATLQKELGNLPQLLCKPQQLNQVFLNLLVNAAQAIDKEGSITVRSWHEEGSIRVAISDTGCGIPVGIRARIFEPFFTTKEVGRGTGLGLSISYDIIKKHGGELLVESEIGKGTTFTVILPVASA